MIRTRKGQSHQVRKHADGLVERYAVLLQVEPYSEESKQLREWAGLDFDPAQFYRLAANTAISRMLWNGWVKIGK